MSKRHVLAAALGVLGLIVSGCAILDSGQNSTSDSSDSRDLEAALESSIESSTQDFADSLIFTFDNFQCFGTYGCKVIYDFDYVGPPNRYSFEEYFSYGKLTGMLIGAQGFEDATLGPVILQENNELVGFGYLDSSNSYSLIINTNSTLKNKYEGVLLQLNSVPIFEDYFGCFKAKKRSIDTEPTC
jgi:hypothetical protein